MSHIWRTWDMWGLLHMFNMTCHNIWSRPHMSYIWSRPNISSVDPICLSDARHPPHMSIRCVYLMCLSHLSIVHLIYLSHLSIWCRKCSFPQKSPVISGSFAKRDLHHKASDAFSAACRHKTRNVLRERERERERERDTHTHNTAMRWERERHGSIWC